MSVLEKQIAQYCKDNQISGVIRVTVQGKIAYEQSQLLDDDFDIIFLSNSGFGNARHDLSEMILQAFYEQATPSGETVEMDKGYI